MRSVPGTSSTAYKVSPKQLLVPTLGELMKVRWPASRNVAVAGKDRAAVMMTGHKADQRWYWTGKAFATDLRRGAGSAGGAEGERRNRCGAGAAAAAAPSSAILPGEGARDPG